jgi:Zn-dependent oligopeptidase
MSNERRLPKHDDESLWDGATILDPDATKDSKVHVTLRLDPELYKSLLAYKRATGARTLTQAVEASLRQSLGKNAERSTAELVVEVGRSIAELSRTVAEMAQTFASHELLQDQSIAALANQANYTEVSKNELDVLVSHLGHLQGTFRWTASTGRAMGTLVTERIRSGLTGPKSLG